MLHPPPVVSLASSEKMSVDSEFLVGAVYKAAYVVGNSSVPFEGYVASGWNHMTENYSKFTIATLFSAILHEVSRLILTLGNKLT